jgi:hypothetical protein
VRFIISEQPYEQPLARGLWRYEKDGHATGAVEQWRLSAAHDGYHFLRVDLDARQAASGRSYLYHAVLDQARRPMRMKYRVWRGADEVIGNVHLEEDAVLFSGSFGEHRFEELITVPEGYEFWFPSCIALGLLAMSQFTGNVTGVALVISDTQIDGPALMPLVTGLEKIGARPEESLESGQGPVRLFWENQQRSIWLDSSGWPRRMIRQDGLLAVESQLVNYQRIN